MNFRAIVCLTLISTFAHADPIDIDDPQALTHLRAIHETLGTASQAITACAIDGGDRQECVCKHQDLVLKFHAAIKTLLQEHPEFADYGTVNFTEADGGTIAQNIAAMIRQMENPPECS